MNTVFLRVLEADDKAKALLEAVRTVEYGAGSRRSVATSALVGIPGSPFAYWLSQSMRDLFVRLPPVEQGDRFVRQGLGTANDFRFVRLWWETARPRKNWRTFVRGGRTSPFYGDLDSVLNWGKDGDELKSWATISIGGGHWSKNIRSTELYFKPGLTWPLRAPRFAPYPVPAESIFSIRGYAFIGPTDELLMTLAVFASLVFDYLYKVLLGRHGYPEFIVGVLQKLPFATLPPDHAVAAPRSLAQHSRRCWSLKRSLETRTENAHAFSLPALLQLADGDIGSRGVSWSEQVRAADMELAEIQAQIDDLCFDLYGIDEADRKAITEGFGGVASSEGSDIDEADAEAEDSDVEDGGSSADIAVLAAELASWAVGVAFGRFDIRLATGERPMPTEPEPFDPLPACSPGMLTGDNGLPLSRPPAGYPIDFLESGVLVDDPGHPRDLTAAARRVFDVVFGADADRWWADVASAIDAKHADLRGWLAGSFFEFHLKRYSKSRRKAPIYWQLATPSASYSVWLYAHRVSRDTFFQLQNDIDDIDDIVGPKLRHEEQRLAGLIERAGATPAAAARKEIAAQESFVEELRAMLEEVRRVAPLWNPDLDDGIVLVMAPLWRLVPQHKAWQKELKSKWDELVAGKYDWAHLAMHLWPERVVPKCATDRSLAIAHGLEDEFWVEGADGKWKARPSPTHPVEELVRERSSPAVKAALKSLLEAPAPGASARRTSAGRRGARA